MIRETIREMDKVAIGRVALTNREHIIALEPMDKGLVGTLLRYPYQVRSEQEYFDEIQDVKVTKDMLDLARHIVNQKAGRFAPERVDDHYETALIELINQKRAGKNIRPKERPKGENVVDLMDAAQERRRRSCREQGCKKFSQKGQEGDGRSEGDADDHRRQEAGQGDRSEEARVRGAAEVGVGTKGSRWRLLQQT